MQICMPRGDIRDVQFSVYDNTGQTISDIPFDEIYVTFKTSTNSPNYLFQKKLSNGTVYEIETGKYQFRIESADTDNLKIGTYVFDIELVFGDDIKQTTVGKLDITPEVTFVTNE